MQRDEIIRLAKSYVGTCEGSSGHLRILNAYNKHKPLARGYTVKTTDAWCMTFISALFIMNNAVDALGLSECGCEEYVKYARKHGMTVKNPIEGDLVFYDWQNDGVLDHVGIVTDEMTTMLEIVEGNKSNMVSTRLISKTSPLIKCIVRPKYYTQSGKYDGTKLSYAQSFSKAKAGIYRCKASDFVALRYNPYVTENNKIAEIKHGETCQNYGYYTNSWLLVQYNGLTGFANEMWLERVGK